MNRNDFTERDSCTKYITPALLQADSDVLSQIREEVHFTRGRTIVRPCPVARDRSDPEILLQWVLGAGRMQESAYLIIGSRALCTL